MMAQPDFTSDLSLGKAVDYKHFIDTDFNGRLELYCCGLNSWGKPLSGA